MEGQESAAVPTGFTLRCTLRVPTYWIGRIAWSPAGRLLATPCADTTVRVWDTDTGQPVRTLGGHTGVVHGVSWSPAGRLLVPGNHDVVDDDGFYQWKSKKDGLKEGEYVPKADGFLARDLVKWPERFKPFSDHLYHPLFQQPYPLRPEDQGQGFPPENTHVQFLAFNSDWAVDQTDRKRSGLLVGAVLKGIKAADDQQKHRPGAGAVADRRLAPRRDPRRRR